MVNIETPPYNLPEIKFDLSDYLFSTVKNLNKTVMIVEYSLNKSKIKEISIELVYDFNFIPCIKLMGTKNDEFFEQISSARVLKIVKNDFYVFLRYESICKL